jgi:putative hemolysin
MEILILFLLLIVNGLFSMYEIALVSSSKARLETLAHKGNNNAKEVLKQLNEPEKILSTIQIGITLIGIITGAFGGIALADDLTPFFQNISWFASYAHQFAFVTVVAIITYFSLIIGELVPKSLALNNPEKISVNLVVFMQILTKITFPFVFLLSISTKLINKTLGIKTGENRPITEEELKFFLNQSSEQGILDKEETEMIKDVFRFTDKKASELMVHRTEVAYIDLNDSKDEVLKKIKENHFSKYLLCNDNIDEILGIVSVKDIILLIFSEEHFDLQTIAQTPVYIPENLTANQILEVIKSQKTNFCVVINEYGSIEGIITLHDLTESIFGDILEENEDDQHPIVLRQDGSYLVDGSMLIDDFMDEMNIYLYEDIENSGFSTLGGLALHFLESIPKEGDTFSYKNLKFEIMDMDRNRVDKILVIKNPEL